MCTMRTNLKCDASQKVPLPEKLENQKVYVVTVYILIVYNYAINNYLCLKGPKIEQVTNRCYQPTKINMRIPVHSTE